ncbi:MAG: type I glutamate--ammonia ligase [Caulobacterales bacterium]|nr:type I glutamate--ammonia ligase [Caulobacterales bacterium]MCA0373100.1 type I glutamate--ammonia ligase [Pseudomonadota bacterium]
MSKFDKVMQLIKDEDVQYVDFRFSDVRGKIHHITYDVGMVDADMLEDGIMFDGSSISGWKAINESDMVMMPDPDSVIIDPFFQQTTLGIMCDVLEPGTLKPYNRCPRGMAKKAEQYIKAVGIGDTVYFGPEPEFFIFDDVKWSTDATNTSFSFDSTELPQNSNKTYEGGNMGHRPGPKGGYFPLPPIDSCQDLRGEMLAVMKELNLDPEKHHHEVSPAQHELGLKFQTLVKMADNTNLYKYVVQNVAAAFGKTATFMPKPFFKENGNGMHVHQSIWKDGKPLFAGDKYADLSQECLYYIGGIIKHAKAINAFANSSTNSYKRLVPGYEAPVLLAYSARNRSASIRIPYSTSPKAKRLEARFPDAIGNMYLTFVALLMAGLDGIINKIDPGGSFDKDLYSLPPEELAGVPTVSASLAEALDNLDKDREFLKAGGVMDDDFIDSFIELKKEEVDRLALHPHPVEFDMYYKM